MKTFYWLFLSVIISCLSCKSSFSQDEIKNYNPPEISEGSNLIINSTPSYVNSATNNNYSGSSLSIDLEGTYTKWRFTPELVYSVYINIASLYDRYTSSGEVESTNAYFRSNNNIYGGISKYLVNKRFYIGIYNETQIQAGSYVYPYQSVHTYPFIGYGYIVNAERVTEMLNLEKVLRDENIIKQPLSTPIKNKLTELLDRRNNNEFTDKYKDNADIEFFTELESILVNEKVINTPFSSRTALELFQKLTNSKFVYFPKYKGYLLQLEYENKLEKMEANTYKNINGMILSGLYGLPVGLKTELAAQVSLEYLFTNVIGYYNYHFYFHSPLAIQENQQMQVYYYLLTPRLLGLGDNYKYDYIFGTNFLAFYNLTSTAGISGNIGFTAGKKNNGFNYIFNAGGKFIYNILTKLQFSTNISVLKDHDTKYYFRVTSGFNYYIF